MALSAYPLDSIFQQRLSSHHAPITSSHLQRTSMKPWQQIIAVRGFRINPSSPVPRHEHPSSPSTACESKRIVGNPIESLNTQQVFFCQLLTSPLRAVGRCAMECLGNSSRVARKDVIGLAMFLRGTQFILVAILGYKSWTISPGTQFTGWISGFGGNSGHLGSRLMHLRQSPSAIVFHRCHRPSDREKM
ncbi:hypothetical protein CI238_01125 [Colletotrichum incanum]|uniref:Uncharacterized protein n=1 Tax=Colletotrichum incanum TaxID=1573173 RepID=A0A162QA15_COLIC|nr:hypothetical protein CI238_01125 [Colletotrichum incanum]